MNVLIRTLSQWFAPLREDLATNGGAPIKLDTRTVGVMLVSCALLTLFFYYARPSFYHEYLDAWVASALNMEKHHLRDLFPYFYWAGTSIVLRILIPLACIIWWFRDSPREYGFRMWEKGHGKIYLGLFLLMLPVVIGVSFSESFQSKYPFYDRAGESLLHFVLYQITYGTQFVALEAFFRGFFIFALFRKFGYYGVVIMTIPYCMIHFGKPMPETLGSIIAGVALGYLAIQSKSWIPGALLHWGVGITMDVVCIIQRAL